jgi:hypothetical protein
MNLRDSIITPRLAKLPSWELQPQTYQRAAKASNDRILGLQTQAKEFEARREALVKLPQREKMAAWNAMLPEVADYLEDMIDAYNERTEYALMMLDTIDDELEAFETSIQDQRAACEEYARKADLLERARLGVLIIYKLPSKQEEQQKTAAARWLARYEQETDNNTGA